MGLMGTEMEVFCALMITGIDGQSHGDGGGPVQVFRAVMHINLRLINVTYFAVKKEGQGEESELGGAMRREDIHVGETEGERHTEQMTRCTFGRALRRLHALLGDF